MAAAHRSRAVFPPGFDNLHPESSEKAAPYYLSTKQLLTVLIDQNSPLTGSELITVKTAWYGKQTVSPRHEFILVRVEGTRAEAEHGAALVNYLVLDRNVSSHRRRNTIQTRLGMRGVPVDGFRISYDGKVNRFLSDCNLNPHRWLGTLEFSVDEPLHLYKLVVLANVVSILNPDYTPIDSNAYMFAGVIWDSLRKLRPSATHHEDLWKERGKNGWFRYVVTESQVQDTYDRTLREISNAKSKIDDQKAHFNALIHARVAAATGQEVDRTVPFSGQEVTFNYSIHTPSPNSPGIPQTEPPRSQAPQLLYTIDEDSASNDQESTTQTGSHFPSTSDSQTSFSESVDLHKITVDWDNESEDDETRSTFACSTIFGFESRSSFASSWS